MKAKTPYDKFVSSKDVVACAYEECLSKKDSSTESGFIKCSDFEAAIEKQVRHKFNEMDKKIKWFGQVLSSNSHRLVAEVERLSSESRVNPCPHCQCSELLCGWPRECSSENSQ